jgi:hypothetical protein
MRQRSLFFTGYFSHLISSSALEKKKMIEEGMLKGKEKE